MVFCSIYCRPGWFSLYRCGSACPIESTISFSPCWLQWWFQSYGFSALNPVCFPRSYRRGPRGLKRTGISGPHQWSPGVLPASVAVMLLLLVFGGVRHDYQSYMEQWAVINAGNIPWTDKSNTYLPLHSFLAPLASVHPLLVKLLFAVTALLTIAISSFGRIAGKEHFGRHEKSILFIATALCPFT